MVDTCFYAFVQTQRTTAPRVNSKLWTFEQPWCVNVGSSTIKKKSTTVLWVVHSWGDSACVGQEYTGTFYSAQICCKPKTALKNKPYRKSNVLKWYTRRKSSFLFSTRPCEMWSSIQWYAVQRWRALGLLQRWTKGGAGVVHPSAGKTWVQWQRLLKPVKQTKSQSLLCYH